MHRTQMDSAKLKQLRTKLNLSQPQLAKKAKVPLVTLRRAEQGQRMNPKTVLALAKYFGVPPDELTVPVEQEIAADAGWRDEFQPLLRQVRKVFSKIDFLGLDYFQDEKPLELAGLYVTPQYADTEVKANNFPPPADSKIVLKDLTPEAVRGWGKRIVFLAGPGYGKSSFVKWLAVQLASVRRNEWRAALDDAIPFPLILREMRLTADVNTWDKLLAHARHTQFDPETYVNPDVLAKAFADGRVFVFLDGLDEIGGDVRTALHAAIWDGMQKYPNCRFLATSRIQGYEVAPLDVTPNDLKLNIKFYYNIKGGTPKEIDIVRGSRIEYEIVQGPLKLDYDPNITFDIDRKLHSIIDQKSKDRTPYSYVRASSTMLVNALRPRTLYFAPFDDARIQEFAQKWYAQRETTAKAAGEKAADLWSSLRQADDTHRLARVPNLLALMALIHRNTSILPRGRAELYDKIANSYLDTIDQFRKVADNRYSAEEMRQWLGFVAYRMQEDRDGEGRQDVLVSREAILKLIQKAMQASLKAGDRTEAEIFLKRILERSGLLLEQGPGQIAFVHLSFLEYFAAQSLFRQFNTALRSRDTEWLGTMKRRTNERHWHETIVFLFQILKQKNDHELHRDVRQALFGAEWERGQGLDMIRNVASILLLELASDPYSWFDLPGPATSGMSSRLDQILWANVRRLDLSFTSISDIAFLAPLTQLQSLDLVGTAVTDAGVATLAPLTQLQSLNLFGTAVTDAGVATLAPLTQLQSLNLADTSVTDAIMATLAPLTQLHTLDLGGTQVTDTGVATLTPLTQLHTLDLSGTSVTDAGVATLVPFTQLHTLNLGATQVTDAGVATIASFTQLHNLSLSYTRVTDAVVTTLAPLKHLQELYLSSTKVTDAGVAELRKSIPNVTIYKRN